MQSLRFSPFNSLILTGHFVAKVLITSPAFPHGIKSIQKVSVYAESHLKHLFPVSWLRGLSRVCLCISLVFSFC